MRIVILVLAVITAVGSSLRSRGEAADPATSVDPADIALFI